MLCCPTKSSPVVDTNLAWPLTNVWFVLSIQDTLDEQKSSTLCFQLWTVGFSAHMIINNMDQTNDQFYKPSLSRSIKWKLRGLLDILVKFWQTTQTISKLSTFYMQLWLQSLYYNGNFPNITINVNIILAHSLWRYFGLCLKVESGGTSSMYLILTSSWPLVTPPTSSAHWPAGHLLIQMMIMMWHWCDTLSPCICYQFIINSNIQ